MKNISKQVLALAATTMLSYGAIQGAAAQDGYYVKGEVGVAMPKKIDDVKFKKSAIFGIEGGYKMNENFTPIKHISPIGFKNRFIYFCYLLLLPIIFRSMMHTCYILHTT